jgi:tagatose-6-phosphate ketose/aldose isomerase
MGKLNNNNKVKGLITKKEIAQQPEVWEKTYDIIFSMKIDIEFFLMKIKIEKDVDIILTGAGTSSFVGGTVCGLLGKHQKLPSRAVTEGQTPPRIGLFSNVLLILCRKLQTGNIFSIVMCTMFS